MKKTLLFLLMLLCINCKTNTTVTDSGVNTAVDEIYGSNQVSYAPRYNAAMQSGTDDMIAMYYGNKNRLKWGKNELQNVVMHTFSDGHKDWFFPTFLYLEFKSDNYLKFGDNQVGDAPATKKEWEWLLNRYFSTDYNGGNYEGLKALDECIESCKKTLGAPAFRHKVVLGIPSPCTDFTEWGSIRKGGRNLKLDFRNVNHKIEAVKWFVDELIKRFEAQHYKNITLDALYWMEENTTMTRWHKDNRSGRWTNRRADNKFDYVFDSHAKRHNDVVIDISEYVHSVKGQKLYWIPYWGAYGSDGMSWRHTFGFDRCDMQTAYFWGTPDYLASPKELVTTSELINRCTVALQDGKGLEFEMNAQLFVPCYAKRKNRTDIERPFEIVKVEGCNKRPNQMRSAGYQHYNYNPCLLARMENLINVFEEQGVFQRANITYYFDNSAILTLCNSNDSQIRGLVDRLAGFICERHN